MVMGVDVVREDKYCIWAGVDVKAGIAALIWEALYIDGTHT